MKRVFFSFYTFFICVLLLVQFLIAPVVGNILDKYRENEALQYSRNLAKGVFHLMEEDLLGRPQEAWPDRIRQLQPYFGYDINLVHSASLDLPQRQMEYLGRSEIAVVDAGDYVYYKIKGSELIITKGPFSVIEPKGGIFQYIFLLAVFVIVAIPTAVWIIPFWRKLNKISTAAIAFGDGDFDTRAEITSRSALAPIAVAFNTMADRIQHLISSHKELTNAVSHELRTPISRIRFGLELLDDPDETPHKKKQYINGLYGDVADLEELVSELLTFAKFDRETPELHIETHSVIPFLSSVLRDIVGKEPKVEYQLVDKLKEGEGSVPFDSKYLERAIDNLVRNAMRYGNQQLRVTVERSSDMYLLHIEDDGPGIQIEDREKIFEPFTRLDSSRNKLSGGYGLGLAIVSRIVKWHGGDIFVTDGSLGGACFTLSLPGK
ncbi:ATP-binding protein [Desulforhopalus sp. 52FAK]